MLCHARSDRRSGFWTVRPRAPRPLAQDLLAERRRELAALLEEIRDPAACPAGADAGEGVRGLRPPRIETPIPALHEAG